MQKKNIEIYGRRQINTHCHFFKFKFNCQNISYNYIIFFKQNAIELNPLKKNRKFCYGILWKEAIRNASLKNLEIKMFYSRPLPYVYFFRRVIMTAVYDVIGRAVLRDVSLKPLPWRLQKSCHSDENIPVAIYILSSSVFKKNFVKTWLQRKLWFSWVLLVKEDKEAKSLITSKVSLTKWECLPRFLVVKTLLVF